VLIVTLLTQLRKPSSRTPFFILIVFDFSDSTSLRCPHCELVLVSEYLVAISVCYCHFECAHFSDMVFSGLLSYALVNCEAFGQGWIKDKLPADFLVRHFAFESTVFENVRIISININSLNLANIAFFFFFFIHSVDIVSSLFSDVPIYHVHFPCLDMENIIFFFSSFFSSFVSYFLPTFSSLCF